MERPPYLAESRPSRRYPPALSALAGVALIAGAFAAGRLTAPSRAGPASSRSAAVSPAVPAAASTMGAAPPERPPGAEERPALPAPSAAPVLQGAVFDMSITPRAAPAAPAPDSPAASEPDPVPEGATLHAELVRCLSYLIEREDGRMPTEAESVRVRVEARNRCDRPFAAADSAFEVRAIAERSGATAGRQIGRFQATIPARGTADTVLDIPARNDEFYRFQASPAADAGAGKKALE